MASIADKRRRRDEFLVALYNRVESDPAGTLAMVAESEIATDVGITDDEAEVISRYLVDQGYATFPVMGNVLSITPAGVDRAEELLEERERAGSELSAVVLTIEEQRALEAAIQPLRAELDREDLDLDPDDRAEIEKDLQVLEGQLQSPRPKREIVIAAMRSVILFCTKAAGAGVIGGGAFAGLVQLARHLG